MMILVWCKNAYNAIILQWGKGKERI